MDAGAPLSLTLKRRMAAGLAVVPPAIAGLAFLGFLTWHSLGILPYGRGVMDPVRAAAAVGLAVGILAGLVTIAGALPAVLWLAERGPLPLSRLLLLGAALGNAPLALIVVGATVVNLIAGTPERGRELHAVTGTIVRVTIGVFCGTAGAAMFWLVAVRGSELDVHGPEQRPHTGDRHASLGTG
jgi:hypothetical protein